MNNSYLIDELNTVKDKVLYDKLIENAITIIKKPDGTSPASKGFRSSSSRTLSS